MAQSPKSLLTRNSSAKSKLPDGVVTSPDGKYDVKMCTFTKEGMLEAVSESDLVNVLAKSQELKKVKKAELLKFLKKSGAFDGMDVASTLPKLEDRDLFQIIADNKDLEKKLNIDAVFRVIKRAGRHAAVMRFTKTHMLKLFEEARLKAYLSAEELMHFAKTGYTGKGSGKRPSKRSGVKESPAKMKILSKFTRKQLSKLLTKEKLTERMPHGSLSKAIKQMTRAEALACIGASDLRRILEQQGLLDKIKLSHIVHHLKVPRLLKVVSRKAVDEVIMHFGLNIDMEELISIILAGHQEEEEEGGPRGFNVEALRLIIQDKKGSGESGVRLVRMDFMRKQRRSSDELTQGTQMSTITQMHSQVEEVRDVTIYGIAEEKSPVVPVCNIAAVSRFVFPRPTMLLQESRPNSSAGKRPASSAGTAVRKRPGPSRSGSSRTGTSSRPGSSAGRRPLANKKKPSPTKTKRSERKDTSPISNLEPILEGEKMEKAEKTEKAEAAVVHIPAMGEAVILGAFLWDWTTQRLILVARDEAGEHKLIDHKPAKPRYERNKEWKEPGGFFNDRKEKMTLSVEIFDEKRLAHEAARCGFVPTAEQWAKISKYDKPRLVEILCRPNIMKLISPASLVRLLDTETLSKLVREQMAEKGKKGRRIGNSFAVAMVCKKAREKGVGEIVRRFKKQRVLIMLQTSNVIDYLNADETKTLEAAPEEKWIAVFNNLDAKYKLTRALSITDLATSIEQMSLGEVIAVLELTDLRSTLLDHGLARTISTVRLLNALAREQLLSVLGRLNGPMVAQAAIGKDAFSPKDTIRELFGVGMLGRPPCHNLEAPASNMLKHAQVGNFTKLLQFTISDSSRQRGTSFFGILDISSLFCFADMDRCALKFITDNYPGVVPGLLIWNTAKQQFSMLAQAKSTRIIELSADMADFSRFSFESQDDDGLIGKWKLSVEPDT
mmetsp:Transcript_4218/g.8108  ORF Transcript_4218/g.8108 Transcript_4218/m.8108 type:complete len:948 (+) Transcript_4218:243-3086(+)